VLARRLLLTRSTQFEKNGRGWSWYNWQVETGYWRTWEEETWWYVD
jgi:hypothetical protein